MNNTVLYNSKSIVVRTILIKYLKGLNVDSNKKNRTYKKDRVFKKTSVKTKRRCIRSMNTAIKVNDYISYDECMFINGTFQIKDDTFHLEFKSLDEMKKHKALIEFNKTYSEILTESLNSDIGISMNANSLLEELSDYCNEVLDCNQNIVYYKALALHDLEDYKIITHEIDNMSIYNRKLEYKETLKELVKMYVMNSLSSQSDWITIFFQSSNYKNIIYQIEKNLFSDVIDGNQRNNLAKKIYTQLLNRVQFKHTKIYHYNSNERNQSNLLKPGFISSLDRLKFKINYIKKRTWMFNEFFLKKIKHYIPNYIETDDTSEYNRILNEETHDKIGSLEYDNYSSDNSSDEYDEYLAPIDYETYSDKSLKDEYRASANSIQKQWGDLYITFSHLIQKQDESNPYFNVKNYANEIIKYYKKLKLNDVFTTSGNINEFSTYVNNQKKEIKEILLENMPNADSKRLKKEVQSILKLKKEEWKCLSDIFFNHNSFSYKIMKYSNFNTEKLEYKIINVLKR